MSKEEFPSEKDLPQEDQEKQAKSAEADKAGVKEDKKAKDNKEEAAKPADAELDQLKAEVAALTQKNKDLEDKYLRSEAEIQNAQRRYSKERANLVKYESQRLGKDILASVDNLERALQVKV